MEQGVLVHLTPTVTWLEKGPIQSPTPLITTSKWIYAILLKWEEVLTDRSKLKERPIILSKSELARLPIQGSRQHYDSNSSKDWSIVDISLYETDWNSKTTQRQFPNSPTRFCMRATLRTSSNTVDGDWLFEEPLDLIRDQIVIPFHRYIQVLNLIFLPHSWYL